MRSEPVQWTGGRDPVCESWVLFREVAFPSWMLARYVWTAALIPAGSKVGQESGKLPALQLSRMPGWGRRVDPLATPALCKVLSGSTELLHPVSETKRLLHQQGTPSKKRKKCTKEVG